MSTLITPPYASRYALPEIIAQTGYALLSPQDLCDIAELDLPELHSIQRSWDDLPADNYLKDGGRYRYRRHSCFVFHDGQIEQTPHRAHWQPIAYNALHGGMERWFEPMKHEVIGSAAWQPLLHALASLCAQLKGEPTWYIEAHQFRIDTTDGIGRPTPEGAHRDGVDFVAVLLVDRVGIKGGETRVFEAAGPNGQRFTLNESWSVLFLDDERVIHESTPIQPTGDAGHRDTLVLTFRHGGFQGNDGM